MKRRNEMSNTARAKRSRMKSVASMALAAVMMMTGASIGAADNANAASEAPASAKTTAASTKAAGTSFSSATNISLGGTVRADIKNTVRYFKFTTSGNDSFYSISIANGKEDYIDCYIYDNNRSELGNRTAWGNDVRVIEDKYSRNATHYIKLQPRSASSEYGPVTITVKELPDNAGDRYQEARALSGSHSGKFQIGGDEDWFRFKAPAAGTYRFSLTCTGDGNFDYWLMDGNVTTKESGWVFSNRTKTFDFRLGAGQVMYLKMSATNPTTYKVSAYRYIHRPSKESITKVKAGKRSLTVRYAKRAYATKYQVQVKRSGRSWKAARTYECGNRLTKKVAKLKRGKKYNVRVRAVRIVNGKAYAGAWSNGRTVKVR